MENAFNMIRDLVSGLSGIFVGVIGLGVVAGIFFGGNSIFFGDVLNQLIAVIQTLGDNGIVGLLAAAILIQLLR